MKDDRRRLARQHLSDSLRLLTRECVLGMRHMMHMCIPSIRLSPTVSAELSMNLSSWLSSLLTNAQNCKQPTASPLITSCAATSWSHSCCIWLMICAGVIPSLFPPSQNLYVSSKQLTKKPCKHTGFTSRKGVANDLSNDIQHPYLQKNTTKSPRTSSCKCTPNLSPI